MFVADDPRPDLWPAGLQADGQLQVLSTSDVYGANRLVDATRQRDTFFGVLAEALAEGYSGIRVAADNTALVTTPETLVAWHAWEEVADDFMHGHPMTALCSFDAERLAPESLAELLAVHPVEAPGRPGY